MQGTYFENGKPISAPHDPDERVVIQVSLTRGRVDKLDRLAQLLVRNRSTQIAYLIDREFSWLMEGQEPSKIQPIEYGKEETG